MQDYYVDMQYNYVDIFSKDIASPPPFDVVYTVKPITSKM